MKKVFLLIIFCNFCMLAFTQQFTKNELKSLRKKEDSLQIFSTNLLQATKDIDRFKADSFFTKTLVRALRTNNSFYYPFDSLQTISKLYSPDSSFRIYTWQLVVNDDLIRQHGAIQMKTSDGSLKLFPLIDKSDIIQHISDTITDNKAWIGAIYYKIIEQKYNGKNIYTLLGYDENNYKSTKKIIEILSFENDVPTFGNLLFNFDKDSTKLSGNAPISRYVMEFKKDADARLTYDEDLGLIVLEHLISETNEPKKKFTLVGDGDYEAFKWTDGKWQHIVKIFHQVTQEGEAPVPKPLKDGGNLLDDKLPQ